MIFLFAFSQSYSLISQLFLSFRFSVNSVINFRTFKLDCPFEILFRASKDVSSLEVKHVIEEDNHEIDEVTLFEWFGFPRILYSALYFLPVR